VEAPLIHLRVKAILDANRNSLMLMDLKFSIGTLGLGAGTLFSALYGMNLKNFIEESDFGFGGVSITCFALTGLVCVYGLFKLRKLQRVRMWGESGVGGSSLVPLSPKRSALGGNRNNWRADSIEPVWGSLPGEGRSERMRRLREHATHAAQQAASRNLKATHASSTAAMQASAAASSKASSADSDNSRAESSNARGKETGARREEQVKPHSSSKPEA
jgi:magnesium transporter